MAHEVQANTQPVQDSESPRRWWRRRWSLTSIVAVAAFLLALLGAFIDYNRWQESKPNVRVVFARPYFEMPVANNKICWAVGFEAVNDSSSAVTVVQPELQMERDDGTGWIFNLIRDTSDEPPGGQLPPARTFADGPVYLPAVGSIDQPTQLEPGEVARYRLPLTHHIVKAISEPEWRSKRIKFEIRDLRGNDWHYEFTPRVIPIRAPRPSRLAKNCSNTWVESQEELEKSEVECPSCPTSDASRPSPHARRAVAIAAMTTQRLLIDLALGADL